MTDFIFRSTHPDVLAAWSAAEDETARHHERLVQQLAEWGFAGHDVLVRSGSFGDSKMLAGISVPNPTTNPLPEGWRIERGTYWHAVPARSTKLGKTITKQWDALATYPNVRDVLKTRFQMPSFIFSGLSINTYAARAVDNVLWVRWGVNPQFAGNEFFEPVKLSAFYTMVEQDGDPFGVD